jgi:hypothetical protein
VSERAGGDMQDFADAEADAEVDSDSDSDSGSDSGLWRLAASVVCRTSIYIYICYANK